jgi:hypothetical protein
VAVSDSSSPLTVIEFGRVAVGSVAERLAVFDGEALWLVKVNVCEIVSLLVADNGLGEYETETVGVAVSDSSSPLIVIEFGRVAVGSVAERLTVFDGEALRLVKVNVCEIVSLLVADNDSDADGRSKQLPGNSSGFTWAHCPSCCSTRMALWLTAWRFPHRLMRADPLISPQAAMSLAMPAASTFDRRLLLASTLVLFAAHDSHNGGTVPVSTFQLTLSNARDVMPVDHDAGTAPAS